MGFTQDSWKKARNSEKSSAFSQLPAPPWMEQVH